MDRYSSTSFIDSRKHGCLVPVVHDASGALSNPCLSPAAECGNEDVTLDLIQTGTLRRNHYINPPSAVLHDWVGTSH